MSVPDPLQPPRSQNKNSEQPLLGWPRGDRAEKPLDLLSPLVVGRRLAERGGAGAAQLRWGGLVARGVKSHGCGAHRASRGGGGVDLSPPGDAPAADVARG